MPASAAADGPITPVATDYLARIHVIPAGLQAKVVDGYLSLWVRAPASRRLVVLDYQGAPYLRFARNGVWENRNSIEFYVNQVPVPATPPPGLTRSTPPHWIRVASGDSYTWREGRLHALTTIALAPGASYVGPWRIPVLIDGHRSGISGGIWHSASPSIVWFWPIVVLLACVLAAWRVRSAELDRRLTRILSLVLLGAIVVAALGRQLHGRPTIAAGQLVILAVVLAAVAAATARILAGRSGRLMPFGIALVSLWAGLTLAPVLVRGYVLVALPPFLARSATALLLGGSLGLVLIAARTLAGDRITAGEPSQTSTALT